MANNKQVQSVLLNGKKIWEEIKDKDINVFAITTKVNQYCDYIDIDDTKCYLLCKASAALPALEATLGDMYKCTLVEKYVLVEKNKK